MNALPLERAPLCNYVQVMCLFGMFIAGTVKPYPINLSHEECVFQRNPS